MTDRELLHACSIVRNWLIEMPNLPINFSEHVAIVTGELYKRLKKEDGNADLDHHGQHEQRHPSPED